ncbi:MAG TPA: ferritin-like domain-containing protein [Longimicrobiaceae bacterium]|nr:ferritin-like domain-containing protein [Longimicrobiaceae bacterium]
MTRFGDEERALAERILSRRAALSGAGRLGVSLLAVAAIPTVFRGRSGSLLAQEALTDQEKATLNFALTLEYLEAAFYQQGLAAVGLVPEEDRPIIEIIGQHEDVHVTLLSGVLGADAVAEPTFDFTAGGMFPDVFTNYATFLALAQGFEDTGVRAYKGQAGNLQSNGGLLTTALQIHSVEGRHAAMVRRMRGQKGWIVRDETDVAALEAVYAGEANTTHLGVDATTTTEVPAEQVSEAWDEPLTEQAVLDIAGPFIVA